MKNHQYIRQLSVKELAKLLVKEVEVNEGDFDRDDNWCTYYYTNYQAPDGELYVIEDDAIKHTMDWLNAERKCESEVDC